MKKLSSFLILLFATTAIFIGCKKDDPAPESNEINITSDISTNTTWLASKIYIINDEISIDGGATLTIEPGTTIKFGPSGSLSVGYSGNATVIANGTSDKPITFTSSAATPNAGTWWGLYFYSNTLNNTSLTHCKILYAGKTGYAAVTISDCKITMNNCTVQYAVDNGVICEYNNGGFMAFNNNTINNCGKYPLRISAETVHTIGSGNTFSAATGYGIDIHGSNFTQNNATWKKQTVPYIVQQEIQIGSDAGGATLNIEAGTEIRFSADGALTIGYVYAGNLKAIGTSTNKIIFTTSATSPTNGAWQGLFFYSNSNTNSELSYCDIMYGSRGLSNGYKGNVNITDTQIKISNCALKYASGYGIYKIGTGSYIGTGNTFTGNTLGDEGTN